MEVVCRPPLLLQALLQGGAEALQGEDYLALAESVPHGPQETRNLAVEAEEVHHAFDREAGDVGGLSADGLRAVLQAGQLGVEGVRSSLLVRGFLLSLDVVLMGLGTGLPRLTCGWGFAGARTRYVFFLAFFAFVGVGP